MAVTIGLICLMLLINFVWAVANYTTILNSEDSEIQQANAHQPRRNPRQQF